MPLESSFYLIELNNNLKSDRFVCDTKIRHIYNKTYTPLSIKAIVTWVLLIIYNVFIRHNKVNSILKNYGNCDNFLFIFT